MKILGAILIVLGLIGLLYGGISYTKREKVIDAGPIQVSSDEKKTIPLPPVAGALALVAGVVLVLRREQTA
jgi:xanthosine utilization system XapX-like protein